MTKQDYINAYIRAEDSYNKLQALPTPQYAAPQDAVQASPQYAAPAAPQYAAPAAPQYAAPAAPQYAAPAAPLDLNIENIVGNAVRNAMAAMNVQQTGIANIPAGIQQDAIAEILNPSQLMPDSNVLGGIVNGSNK